MKSKKIRKRQILKSTVQKLATRTGTQQLTLVLWAQKLNKPKQNVPYHIACL